MTSVLQPMHLGIIRCLKHHYRHKLVLRRIDQIEGNQPQTDVNILDAVNIVAYAWNKVKPDIIANCFRKAGFRKAEYVGDGVNDENHGERYAESGLFDNDFEKLKIVCLAREDLAIMPDFDSAVEITGQLTDDDIIDICLDQKGDKENHSSDCDSLQQNEVSPKNPTQEEVKKAIDVLIARWK
jgi:DDE superfamily endonuclease